MKRTFNILLLVGSLAAVAAVIFVVSAKPASTIAAPTLPPEPTIPPSLPPLNTNSPAPYLENGIPRFLQLKTKLSEGPGYEVTEYIVKRGDSPWSIAQKFDLKPETILWGNPKLNAAAGSLKAGDTLIILPVDGVLHVAEEGDTLEGLARVHGTSAQEILEYLGNDFDLTQPPQLKAGQQVIIPNGTSPIVWSEAQVPIAAQSGVRGGYSGNVPNLGSGYFSWPVNGYVLTQEYWSGHPGLDLATDFRQPIFASDSGTVVFSGWDDTGYGYFIIIDHGNGYKTTYGHNEANLVSVGQTVVQGQQIAEAGSTGNSTGDHLDFRILYNGVFLNPLDYLP
ncbi:MAG: peptidoglycan DD-metalloendopeptidase family protein [Chloroflexi bacterium]|nr:peptidoglycan DD-metalloendopeptidase family protein [Chloroflexota bacterium]